MKKHNLREVFEEEITDLREDVKKTHQNVVESLSHELFSMSPHYIDSDSSFAKSEYDANHWVIVDGKGNRQSSNATFSSAVSNVIHNARLFEVLDDIKCGSVVSLFNVVDHAIDVEFGENWVISNGYHTYWSSFNAILYDPRFQGCVEDRHIENTENLANYIHKIWKSL